MIQHPSIGTILLASLAASGMAAMPMHFTLSRSPIQSGASAEAAAYKSCAESAPQGTQRGFKLRHDYPRKRPVRPASGVYPWQSIDVRSHRNDYFRSVLDYARAGLEPIHWDAAEQKGAPHWFHAPWLASGLQSDQGREFFHGLRLEPNVNDVRSTKRGLATKRVRTFSVEYYNDVAAWTIQGAFGKDVTQPDLDNIQFADGAMSIQLIFTEASEADLPSLKGTLEWRCNAYKDSVKKRSPILVRLFEVDVAVRDTYTNPSLGWLFERFDYDGALPGATVFDRLVPSGASRGRGDAIFTTDGIGSSSEPLSSLARLHDFTHELTLARTNADVWMAARAKPHSPHTR